MAVKPQVLDAPLCPLCGQPNRCRPAAAGDLGVDCWCMHVDIPRERLDAIPLPLRGRACLCPACAGAADGEMAVVGHLDTKP
jgi:hypothetical protein